ncbi:hypothetical protein RhoFasB10_03240 [Rhodococcus sp. B10]|nr:hypothetical protein [Rhodococcus sp. B10]
MLPAGTDYLAREARRVSPVSLVLGVMLDVTAKMALTAKLATQVRMELTESMAETVRVSRAPQEHRVRKVKQVPKGCQERPASMVAA